MTLIRAFASKCKYCGNFRVSPHHLKHNHSIDIQLFSIESAYLEWKQAKKAWGDLTRDMIVQNDELLVQGFINQLGRLNPLPITPYNPHVYIMFNFY